MKNENTIRINLFRRKKGIKETHFEFNLIENKKRSMRNIELIKMQKTLQRLACDCILNIKYNILFTFTYINIYLLVWIIVCVQCACNYKDFFLVLFIHSYPGKFHFFHTYNII